MGSKSSDFYSVKALAEKLGISRSRCYELVKQEDIPFKVLVVGGRMQEWHRRLKMVRSIKNKKLVFFIVLIMITFGILAWLIAQVKPSASTSKNVFSEKNYTIISQVPCDLTLSIPRNSIPEEAFSENGYTFSANEIIVYQTETTIIYLEHIQLSNESDGDLYFVFNCSYNLPESGSFISPYCKAKEGGYRFNVSLKNKSLRDDAATYEDTLSFRGHGPGQQFALYVSTDACKAAVGTMYIDITSFYEITYHKKK